MEQKPEDGDEDAQATKIDWKIIEDDVDKPFVASGLEFVPLPVTQPALLSSIWSCYLFAFWSGVT